MYIHKIYIKIDISIDCLEDHEKKKDLKGERYSNVLKNLRLYSLRDKNQGSFFDLNLLTQFGNTDQKLYVQLLSW